MGLRSILKRKFVVTTNSNYQYLITKNELNIIFLMSKISPGIGVCYCIY